MQKITLINGVYYYYNLLDEINDYKYLLIILNILGSLIPPLNSYLLNTSHLLTRETTVMWS